MALGVVLVLLSGVIALGAPFAAAAQDEATPLSLPDVCELDPQVCQNLEFDETEIHEAAEAPEEEAAGESVFGAGAAADLLAIGAIPALPAEPAALALQRVRIAPGGHIETPADDPRVVLLYVESGTLTVRNTVDTTVTRGLALATPGAQAQETIPAETEFTMTAGDFSLSPAGSGGELRNDGAEEVILLAGVILPIPADAATPGAGTPVP
jgi:hypothetical protein